MSVPDKSWRDAPRVRGALPWVGAGLSLLSDPTRFLERWRARLGDTFLVECFGERVLCVFSAEGVKNLWALPEAVASKGLADFALLRHKVPVELFLGRRTLPHGLFGRGDVEVYLENLALAAEVELDALGEKGELEAFAFCRRLAHRMGLASWGGREATEPANFEPLVEALDALDSSESFVHPHQGFITWATGKRRERRALERIEAIYGRILARRDDSPVREDDLFDRIRASWADVEGADREKGIARDVVLVHMGSQSNLFAAMAWTIVHLLERPPLREQVEAGDSALLERCAHESIRLRQRSIVLRRMLRDSVLLDEHHAYALERGLFIATMMSVTNTTALPSLDEFDPAHYRGPNLAAARALPARELVTTFGHGAHYCPAARFSTSAIRIAASALLERFELAPRFEAPSPLRRQIGGVARADRACKIQYRRRD